VASVSTRSQEVRERWTCEAHEPKQTGLRFRDGPADEEIVRESAWCKDRGLVSR
jgi:hypothetical protein